MSSCTISRLARKLSVVIAATLCCLGLVLPNSSHAHGRVGFYVGINAGHPAYYGGYGYRPYYQPYYWGPSYYAPIYYTPPVTTTVIVPPEPTVYVQRPVERTAPPVATQQYWYFCRESQAYYPYVQQCTGPWQPVAAMPPNVSP
ncbi:hypothetical protein [Parvibium lacunae]|uniref:Lipoprotein n=1 Tax=Parvibium lacunae TaxID=1888893 RepID=A0A368L523_9BURK|nr:hypothetical protein [Parvibium lacunae]RCS58250.1 hypothetical protein DU000_05340 [Parvibium lacunae]